eukprot:11134940-Alexandrium_andersonii.AAC.1
MSASLVGSEMCIRDRCWECGDCGRWVIYCRRDVHHWPRLDEVGLRWGSFSVVQFFLRSAPSNAQLLVVVWQPEC